MDHQLSPWIIVNIFKIKKANSSQALMTSISPTTNGADLNGLKTEITKIRKELALVTNRLMKGTESRKE